MVNLISIINHYSSTLSLASPCVGGGGAGAAVGAGGAANMAAWPSFVGLSDMDGEREVIANDELRDRRGVISSVSPSSDSLDWLLLLLLLSYSW